VKEKQKGSQQTKRVLLLVTGFLLLDAAPFAVPLDVCLFGGCFGWLLCSLFVFSLLGDFDPRSSDCVFFLLSPFVATQSLGVAVD